MLAALSIAGYAQMINGEGWIPGKLKCKLRIVKVTNNEHDMLYTLPVKPSPKLNTQQSICFVPLPACLKDRYSIMVAEHIFLLQFFVYARWYPGMAETPLHMNETCYDLDLRNYDVEDLRRKKQINIQWMIDLCNNYPGKDKYFDHSYSNQMVEINKLAGNTEFKKQIMEGRSA